MKNLKPTLLLLTLLLLPLLLFSQIEPPISIKKGRVFTTDGKEKLVRLIQQKEDKFICTALTSRKKQEYNIDDVLRIDQQSGNKALMFSGVMGTSALLGSYLGVKQADSQLGGHSNSDSNSEIILGLTAAGAIIGFIWGSTKKKYKTVYKNPNFTHTTPSFHLELKNQMDVPSVSLVYSF